MKTEPQPPEPQFTWNPNHSIGTCARCGDEMIYNVPRMGPAGGFIHKSTHDLMCGGLKTAKVTEILESYMGYAKAENNQGL